MTRLAVLALLLAACGPAPRDGRQVDALDAGDVPTDAGEEPTDAGGCVPETDLAFCARLGRSCDTFGAFDNCGASRVVPTCGTCEEGLECRGGACVDETCEPETDAELCAALGRTCGGAETIDRCGTPREIVSCGTCTAGTCVGGACGACAPESDEAFCARLEKNCETVTALDDCGSARSVDCGDCGEGQTCGAQTANVCGTGACVPESDLAFCARLGRDCSSLTQFDNCGNARTVSFCGDCTDPMTCGGDGQPGVCGCKSESDAAFCADHGKNCDTFTGLDRCGRSRTVSCGAGCTLPQNCGAVTPNVCGCVPESDAAFCTRLGAQCGRKSGTDNCGQARTVSQCGTCLSPRTCGATSPNQCGCPETSAQICTRKSAECGSLVTTDICGQPRTIASCGTCELPSECGTTNRCGCSAESDAALCSSRGFTCGVLRTADACAVTREIDCGLCPPPAGAGALSGMQAGAAWPADGFGPARQRVSPHKGPVGPTSNPGLNRYWAYEMPAYSTPVSPAVAADGTIYTGYSTYGTASALIALKPDGTVKWKLPTTFGVTSAPTIAANGSIYFGTGHGSTRHLHCATPAGATCVGYPIPTKELVTSAPLIDASGRIYLVGGQRVQALQPDGAERWGYDTGAQIRGTPALDAGGHLYVLNQAGVLLALASETGDVVRRVTLRDLSGTFTYDVGSPALSTDGLLVYVSLPNGKVHGIRSEQHPDELVRGLVLWTFTQTMDFRGSPAVGPDGTVYVTNASGRFFAIAPGNIGEVTETKWSNSIGTGLPVPPGNGHYGEHAPFVGSDGSVYVVTKLARLHGFDANGGAIFSGRSLFPSSESAGNPAIGSDGRVLVPVVATTSGGPSHLVAFGSQ